MTIRIAALAALLCLAAVPADARPMGGHGGGFAHGGGGRGGFGHRPFGHGGFGHHGFHGRSSVFFGGGFFWDPFYYPGYYPYPVPYAAYPYGYAYGYGSPPDDSDDSDYDYEDDQTARAEPPEDPMRASYGLVQLRNVPNGATVDLDGRPWLTAEQLDQRWLALPHGSHTLVVRAEGASPVERRVDVSPGGSVVVRFPTAHGAR